MLYPLTFNPIFKERVWGGKRLAELYRKSLPDGIPIGESWEVSDRPGDVSVIRNGPLAGKDLHWLLQHHDVALTGKRMPVGARFPLLIKILDAQEKLSLQVHPPADKASALGGEPKTEMWHVVGGVPGAELYVGLKSGVGRPEFEARIKDGTVAGCFHRIPVKPGDTMFLPGGRVHAIGAGLIIFEIQQNSDSTFRVYDWDRCGLDGKPRQLHIAESLACINFDDHEPGLVSAPSEREGDATVKTLAENPFFTVRECGLNAGRKWDCVPNRMQIIGVISGSVKLAWRGSELPLDSGEFCLVPFECRGVAVTAETEGRFLVIYPGT